MEEPEGFTTLISVLGDVGRSVNENMKLRRSGSSPSSVYVRPPKTTESKTQDERVHFTESPRNLGVLSPSRLSLRSEV